MDAETKKKIIDYWDPGELVEFLGASTEEVVEAFEESLEEALDDIEEFMNYGTR